MHIRNNRAYYTSRIQILTHITLKIEAKRSLETLMTAYKITRLQNTIIDIFWLMWTSNYTYCLSPDLENNPYAYLVCVDNGRTHSMFGIVDKKRTRVHIWVEYT
jgi:hypothetical protein